jgi:hypothetical protein
MRDEAVRALRAYEERMQQPQLRRVRSDEESVWEPPLRREAPPRAYGSRRRDDAMRPSVVLRPDEPSRTSDLIRPEGGVAGRRTIEITGHTTPPPPRRRSAGASSSAAAAFVGRPDRTALWAFLLALFLVLMAVATAHAATF